MILAVSGIVMSNNNYHQKEYQRKYYQPQSKVELQENIRKDFDSMLKTEISKLQINVLI